MESKRFLGYLEAWRPNPYGNQGSLEVFGGPEAETLWKTSVFSGIWDPSGGIWVYIIR